MSSRKGESVVHTFPVQMMEQSGVGGEDRGGVRGERRMRNSVYTS